MDGLLDLEAFEILWRRLNPERAICAFDAEIRCLLTRIKDPDFAANGLVAALHM